MAAISKIRTINSRIRRGEDLISTRTLMGILKKMGLTTSSGYISKSKKATDNPHIENLFRIYEKEREKEKLYSNYRAQQDFEGLLAQFVVPSDWYQAMRKSNNANDFVDKIIAYIKDYNLFEKDYKLEIVDYIKKQYYE